MRMCAWRGSTPNPVGCCEIERSTHAKGLAHTQVYAGPLAGGARAVVLLNRHLFADTDNMQNITVTWKAIGLPSTDAVPAHSQPASLV